MGTGDFKKRSLERNRAAEVHAVVASKLRMKSKLALGIESS